jgi:transcriptional regulator with XRE-family HTH domain
MKLSGENIKTLRLSKGIKLSRMAKECGVTRVTLWRFESGGDMLLSNAQKIAEYMGQSIVLKDGI